MCSLDVLATWSSKLHDFLANLNSMDQGIRRLKSHDEARTRSRQATDDPKEIEASSLPSRLDLVGDTVAWASRNQAASSSWCQVDLDPGRSMRPSSGGCDFGRDPTASRLRLPLARARAPELATRQGDLVVSRSRRLDASVSSRLGDLNPRHIGVERPWGAVRQRNLVSSDQDVLLPGCQVHPRRHKPRRLDIKSSTSIGDLAPGRRPSKSSRGRKDQAQRVESTTCLHGSLATRMTSLPKALEDSAAGPSSFPVNLKDWNQAACRALMSRLPGVA